MKHARRKKLFIYFLMFVAVCGVLSVVFTLHQKGVAPAISGSYYVVSVADGDTITVDMNGIYEKIRLIGVDTPETHKPNTPVQCYGPEASEFTKKSLEKTYIRLESDEINQDRDRYGRLLRYVYTADGTLWNKQLVALGFGRALTAFPFTKSEEFKLVEQTAKVTSQGLWAKC